MFGRRLFVDQSRFYHRLTVYVYTWLAYLIVLAEIFYRKTAFHRRSTYYRRFRRGKLGRMLPSIRRGLHRLDRFIVAQGVQRPKIRLHLLSRRKRSLLTVGQVMLSVALVFVMWIYWPSNVSAPVHGSARLDEPGLVSEQGSDSRTEAGRTSAAAVPSPDNRPLATAGSAEDDSTSVSPESVSPEEDTESPRRTALAENAIPTGRAEPAETSQEMLPEVEVEETAPRHEEGTAEPGFQSTVQSLLAQRNAYSQNEPLRTPAENQERAFSPLPDGEDIETEDRSGVPNGGNSDSEANDPSSETDTTFQIVAQAIARGTLNDGGSLVESATEGATEDVPEDTESESIGSSESGQTDDVELDTAATANTETDGLSAAAIQQEILAQTSTASVSAAPPIVSYPHSLERGAAWDSFTPEPAAEIDHYWLDYPFPSGYSQAYSPNYQFGSTASGLYRAHHGVDISNPAGTPVLAVAEGEIIHAGPDNPTLLGPYNNFYGNTVVVHLQRKLSTPEGEKDVYVLYGHLSEVHTQRGRQVAAGDAIGTVGMTGIAIGPHLHLEVRVGQNSYMHTVNPALWLRPLSNRGTVAVRLLDAEGRSWAGARLSLLRYGAEGIRWSRHIETYRNMENLSGDPLFGENGAMGNLAPGAYYITAEINGEKLGQNIDIRSGETTFVELRTQQ